ncbi:MAG: NusG domain II-containing protein [Clostridia bacterium]|nr:NusG domain II-containing protein [Clostridia bacterium]
MEKKSSISKNLLVIAIVIVLIAVVAIVAATQQRELNPTLGELGADATATPAVTVTDEPAQETADAASPMATKAPAEAYLVVSVAGAMYEPIPLYEEGRYTITRGDMVNVIAVTPDSVWMHESTCDNQDCVLQGTVSLSNKSERVLQNMILCLPNEVILELYTPEELAAMLLSMAGYTGEEGNE